MTNWKQVAAAMGVDVTDEKTLAPLQGLETSFRPLTGQLSVEDEPASLFTRTMEVVSE